MTVAFRTDPAVACQQTFRGSLVYRPEEPKYLRFRCLPHGESRMARGMEWTTWSVRLVHSDALGAAAYCETGRS